MATEKSFQLYINEDNVKQYFSASGGALNGASIGGKYITMRTSSTTATFTMNDAGRDVLFPSATAIAHKVDVWAQAIATLSSSKNTINVAIAGQNAVATEKISTSLTEHTGSVSGSFTKSSTSAIYTIKIANGFHAAGVRDTSITAYFTQYACTANRVGNGVKHVSVSNAAPYEGETVTFSAELYNGANFEGWFSDANCTQLVSSSTSHAMSAMDLTLYAKATTEAEIYNCAAIAGENIASAVVSDDSVVSGDNVTFTAQLENEGCLFDGWYSDSSYTNLVSLENPYTVTITSDTTLYAKAHKKQFTMSVGAAEHGVASVSASVAYYGDIVGFTFTPEDDTWELYGWYSDAEFTNLVSEDNPYSFTATTNVTLYPKVGKKRYTITFGRPKSGLYAAYAIDVEGIVVYYDKLTRNEIECLRTGNYDGIDSNKIIERKTAKGSVVDKDILSTITCPYDAYIALYAHIAYPYTNSPYYGRISNKRYSAITYWPYYWCNPTEDMTFYVEYSSVDYYSTCTAVIKEGVDYAYATTPTRSGYEAIFEAEVTAEYKFVGWYSDETCTQLVSTDNPAKIITPDYDRTTGMTPPLTLYAKATPIASQSTGIFLKQNGVYVEVATAYKKVDGVWVADVDGCKTLLSQTNRVGTIVKKV